MEIFNKYYLPICIFIILIAGFNIFYSLELLPINDWDEARHGVTAFEMNQSGNYLITTYQDYPDYWNLKPPLGSWLIAISYQIFGNNTFALRFPSALAALLCIILMMYLAKQIYNSQVSILSGIVLTTGFWFIFMHCGRTGDFDAQMTLLVILTILFLLKTDTKTIYFCLTGLCFSLAFLLKSYLAIQILLIVGCYLIFTKKFELIKLRHYIIFIFFASAPILFWAIARFNYDGLKFFQTMVEYDLVKKSFNGLEGHNENIFYYIYSSIWGLFPWSLFPIGILFLWKKLKIKLNYSKSPILLIWILVPFILFSLAFTKCYWYIYPTYPALAILIGLALNKLFTNKPQSKFLLIVFLMFFITAEARSIIFIEIEKNKSYQPISTSSANHLTQAQVFERKVLNRVK